MTKSLSSGFETGRKILTFSVQIFGSAVPACSVFVNQVY